MSEIKLWNYATYDVDRLSKLTDQKREEGRNYAKQVAAEANARIKANAANAVNLTEGYSISTEGMRNKETGEVMSEEEKSAWLERHNQKYPELSLLQAYRPTSGKGAERVVSQLIPEGRNSASNMMAFLNNVSASGIDVRV